MLNFFFFSTRQNFVFFHTWPNFCFFLLDLCMSFQFWTNFRRKIIPWTYIQIDLYLEIYCICLFLRSKVFLTKIITFEVKECPFQNDNRSSPILFQLQKNFQKFSVYAWKYIIPTFPKNDYFSLFNPSLPDAN